MHQSKAPFHFLFEFTSEWIESPQPIPTLNLQGKRFKDKRELCNISKPFQHITRIAKAALHKCPVLSVLLHLHWKLSLQGLCLRGEREFPFPSISKNESLWFPFPNYGNGFFHSLSVPELLEWFFFIPFPFPNCGNGFYHSLPVPELWECFF